MADQVERRVIEVLGRIDQSFARDLKAINAGLQGVQKEIKAIQSLGTGVIGGFIGLNTLQTLTQIVDQQTTLRRSLAATIPVGQDLVETQEELLDVSVRTQQSLESVTQLYTRLTIAITDVNVKQSDVIKTVEAFGNTMLIAGTGIREAAAATTQFGQALASGRLQGDEFRSLMENVPVLARVLAENLQDANGEFGVTIGELRELSRAGELTTERVIEAVTRGFDDLQKQTANIPRTIGAGVQALTDAFGQLIGTFDRLTGASAAISSYLVSIAEFINANKEVIAILAGPAGVGVLFAGLAAVLLALAAPLAVVAASFGTLGFAIVAGTGIVATFVTQLEILADQLNLFGAEDISLERALSLKDAKSIISDYTEVQAKLEELRETRDELLTRREALLDFGATLKGTDDMSEQLRVVTAELTATNQAMLDQQEVADVLRGKYDELTKGVDETAKAYKAAEAAQEAFSAGAAKVTGELNELKLLNQALAVSKGEYERVKEQQEIGAKIAKDWADAQKAGAPADRKDEIEALSRAVFDENKQLDRSLDIQKELADLAEEAGGVARELQDQQDLAAALDLGINAYERLLDVKKVNADIDAQVKKVTDVGGEVDDNLVNFYRELALAKLDEAEANEKRLAGLKAIQSVKEDTADLQAQIADQQRLNDALGVSAEAHQKLQREIEAENVVEEERQRLIAEGATGFEGYLNNLRAATLELSGLKAAAESSAAGIAALNSALEAGAAVKLQTENFKEQAAALQINRKAFEDTVAAQERKAEVDERLKLVAAFLPPGMAVPEGVKARIEATIQERQNAEALVQTNEKLLSQRESAAQAAANEIKSGRERFKDSQEELKLETERLELQLNALQQSKELGEQEKVIQTARERTQEIINQLSKEDIALRKTSYDQIYQSVLAQEQLKQKIKETQAEQKKQEKLKELRVQFEEGPRQAIATGLESVEQQLKVARIANEEERRLVKDKYDDQLELLKLVEKERKKGLILTDQEIEGLQKEIELTSQRTRELEKQLEVNKAIENIKEEADPFKKLREERTAIESGLARGDVFIGQDETDAAKARLAELDESVLRLKATAESLQSMGNPYAGLVSAAAEANEAFQTFAKGADPSTTIQQGGEAALAVLGQISETMRALGIENFEIQKGIAIAQATINAALAVTKVLSEGGVLAIPLAGAIAALAGAQIAIIASQQPPQRATGGPVLGSKLYRVGEQGPEMYRSLSGRQYMIPGEGGNVTPGRVGGVVVNNLGPPVRVTDSGVNEKGEQYVTIDAAVKAVRKDFEAQMNTGFGSYPRSINRNTHTKRRVV